VVVWDAKRVREVQRLKYAEPSRLLEEAGRELQVLGLTPPEKKLRVAVLMTTTEVARMLRVDPSTVSKWRSCAQGPRATWLTPNTPRYARADILAWLRSGCRVTIRNFRRGPFQAIIKAGRTQVCSNSFSTRRETQA